MFKYTLQRILYMCMVLLIITAMCFVLVRMLPPAELPPGDPHTEVVEARREALGYNKPYMVQFGIFLKNIFTKFDWGVSDKLYKDLQAEGIEVIYDDRDIRPGAMFSDADLLGVPVRVVVSPKNLDQQVIEIVTRDKSISVKAPVDQVIPEIKRIIAELKAAIDANVPEAL